MYAGTRDEPIALGDRNWASAEAPVEWIDFWQRCADHLAAAEQWPGRSSGERRDDDTPTLERVADPPARQRGEGAELVERIDLALRAEALKVARARAEPGASWGASCPGTRDGARAAVRRAAGAGLARADQTGGAGPRANAAALRQSRGSFI